MGWLVVLERSSVGAVARWWVAGGLDGTFEVRVAGSSSGVLIDGERSNDFAAVRGDRTGTTLAPLTAALSAVKWEWEWKKWK